ncbi:MAG: cation diffusion facilitator family transporter [bacterium]|nr:cation diffusion facilitator family transporter [bacterium]
MMRLLHTPYGALALACAMYVLKVFTKLAIGTAVHSPVITGDGTHNIADLVEIVLIVGGIALARLPATKEYPFGRKNVERIAEVGIGLGLLVVALSFAVQSASALLAYAPGIRAMVTAIIALPKVPPLRMGAAEFPWVVGVMGGSAVLSFLVSTIEVRAGHAHGHPSLVADGEETRSDGIIEITACIGICGEYLFRAPWLEYILGMGVALLITRTGIEILCRGWDGLLQRSLGEEVETTLRDAIRSMRGVAEVTQITTFRIGGTAEVIAMVTARGNPVMLEHLRCAIEDRCTMLLTTSGFPSAECRVQITPPPRDPYRVAYAIRVDGDLAAVVSSLSMATHLRICDMEDGRIIRTKDIVLPATPERALALLLAKNVREIRILAGAAHDAPWTSISARIRIARVATCVPWTLGC